LDEKLEQRLTSFLAAFDRERLASDAVAMGSHDREQFVQLLDIYLGEARVGLELIAPYLDGVSRILEVGSGIGILTAFLKAEGYDIVGIEPGADGGFGFMTAMSHAIVKQTQQAVRPDILPIAAEDLRPDVHGQFDLIFSVNVMEHVSALPEAVQAMAGVLAPDGVTRHLCANYAFPYEPHMGIPLVPMFPQATRFLAPALIREHQAIWQSLNFITASQMRLLSATAGLHLELERGVMSKFFKRLSNDPDFARRHGAILLAISKRPVIASAISRILAAIPPTIATPMIMTLGHGQSGSGQRRQPHL
jgi:SAM-dependent methyltransferase